MEFLDWSKQKPNGPFFALPASQADDWLGKTSPAQASTGIVHNVNLSVGRAQLECGVCVCVLQALTKLGVVVWLTD